ncbi:MAG TPA: lipid-binding SYLF domain-containing protein [Terriglobales bacterium]|nr:lipid-binding SYLF domain-containing protein [Terriglobales bacterium]
MLRVVSLLLWMGLAASALAQSQSSQQTGPVPPPQPPDVTQQQPASSAASAATPPSAQSTPAGTQSAPGTAAPQSDQPQHPAVGTQVLPGLQKGADTTSDANKTELPESDRLDAESQRLEADLEKIEARRQMLELEQKTDDRLKESRALLNELLNGPTKIPNSMLNGAKCVVVIPAVKKAAVGFGGKYGRGVMSCRLGDEYDGNWSAPSMYALEGGNFGLQIGLESTDLVLLIMNGRGADSLLGSKSKLGGDLSVAAGPWGRTAEASTDLAMRAKILAYSRAHGIFAGVSLDGSTLRPDEDANTALYKRDLSARQIVRSGRVPIPRNAAPLIRLLSESTSAASGSSAQAIERK